MNEIVKKNSRKKTTKKLKVLGVKEYIDENGEVQKMNIIKMEDRDFNFEKIWIAHILDSLEAIGNQKIKVMTHLLKLKNNDNMIIATQEKISNDINVSRPIISETIKILIDADFLQLVQKGVYRINPNSIFKGGQKNRLNVLLQYDKTNSEKKKK